MARPVASMCLIQKVTRLAKHVFNREIQNSGVWELDQIKKLVSNITVSDLNIDPALLEDRGPYNPSRGMAPVTYMQIYEDADITICVFILKNGVRLPLHDHPDMTGILKVIHGSISVKSYTMDCSSQQNKKKLSSTKPFPGIYQAVKHPCMQISSSDPVCVLRPSSNNLHEISSYGGLAAFLDILSPPYGTDKRSGEERDCHYFEEIDAHLGCLNSDKVYLVSIPTPLEFWCDQAEYRGPPVNNLEFLNGEKES